MSIMSKNLSRRQLVTAAGAFSTLLALGGCTAKGAGEGGSSAVPAKEPLSGSVAAVGSTALQPLVEAAAEQFMAANPGMQISVQGGGSGQGITQIFAGSVQIGNSDVFAEEKLDNPADAATLTDNQVAVVGMGPVVNPGVSVDDLTLDQLRGIFTGSITNWSELGGDDAEIVVINRASGSGTRATFERAVLRGQEVPASFSPQEQDSSGTVAKMVAETPGSISYLAFSYFSDDLKTLRVGGVAPEAASVETNDWTIWAYEHMYTSANPDAATAAFIDYMLSDEVQGSLVEQVGYIPVSGMRVTRSVDGTVTGK